MEEVSSELQDSAAFPSKRTPVATKQDGWALEPESGWFAENYYYYYYYHYYHHHHYHHPLSFLRSNEAVSQKSTGLTDTSTSYSLFC